MNGSCHKIAAATVALQNALRAEFGGQTKALFYRLSN
jgi:hypothetical protein